MTAKNIQYLRAFIHSGGFTLENVAYLDKGPGEYSQDLVLEAELYRLYKLGRSELLFYLAFLEGPLPVSDDLSLIHLVSQRFLFDLTHTVNIEETWGNRCILPSESSVEFILSHMPFVDGEEWINEDWIKGLYLSLGQVFRREMSEYEGTVAGFLKQRSYRFNVVGDVFFHLVESHKSDYPFAFLATYCHRKPGSETGRHIPLKNAFTDFKEHEEELLKLLSTVSLAAQKSAFIAQLLESGELFSPLKISANEAYTFLNEIELYEGCGILCRIPNWWTQERRHLKLNVTIGDTQPSMVGLDALVSFDARLSLGDEQISEAEAKAILTEANGLLMIKGKWVAVDYDKLKATLAAYEKAKSLSEAGGVTLIEALRLQLNRGETLRVEDTVIPIEVKQGHWLSQAMHHPSIHSMPRRPGDLDGLKATLRDYQDKGLNWLIHMKKHGFGALLADDMGLGKTVQIIALLELLRVARMPSEISQPIGHSLLIMPASLMGNWERELKRFAPHLDFTLLYNHGDVQKLIESTRANRIVLTTYGIISRWEVLRHQTWHIVVIDEAQAIKNPGTKQTKAVKQLKAHFKVALTGTPIENRLSDLWSLFDFLNSGLLGSAKEFQLLTRKLKAGQVTYGQLRDLVQPFILRRLKTDKAIIDTLPEKLEVKAFTNLSKKQVVLYQALVKKLEQKLDSAEGISRKGLVLSSLMQFKQICNHPDHYLGQQVYSPEHSGKFQRLAEICDTICQKRERVLVFTQFRELVEPLNQFLERLFMRKGLVLHGGTPLKSRQERVMQFNGESYTPYMVLSLKAGGVGLNLTGANHVIHFDRWWNPAVENQATDRAYRIGQERNVIVHKMISIGTIEEKIDSMIESKVKLSEDLIATTGEGWITELSNKQLIELLTLS